ncbi:SAM-dependent methyltransferase [Candidatus Dojkabacteria bacterium]|nr:SAM-dependent methyltransferase [Candidatus Dojkabacteria bacterium]
MSTKGKLFLIPKDIGGDPITSIPDHTKENIRNINTFIVEDIRTARRFLAALSIKVQSKTFIPWGKHADKSDAKGLLNPLSLGENIGIISESGCPAIADPGKNIVLEAHRAGYQVVPLIGPSSIFLALMASGLNGQNFCFNGYIPKDPTARKSKIKLLENCSQRNNQTQIFMETPFRTQHVLNDLLSVCSNSTKLCLAVDITTSTEVIKTMPIGEWKKLIPNIHKKLVIYLIGQ